MRLRITSVLAVVLTLLVPPNAALAADPPAPQQLTWKLTFDPPRPQTSPAAAAAQPRAAAPSELAEDDDLKSECAKHPQAQTDQGWPRPGLDLAGHRAELPPRCCLRARLPRPVLRVRRRTLAHGCGGTRSATTRTNRRGTFPVGNG